MLKCPNCGFDSPPDMIYCGMCGTRVAQACLNCGQAMPLDYRFCGQCGTSLSGEDLPAQATRLSPHPTLIPDEAAPSGEAPHPLPEEVSPQSIIQPTPSPLIGEHRQATIVIADVKSSTDLMEQIGTEAWVEVMNRVLQILAAEVNRFGGEVDQFRGDGLVAFFGAKSAHEDDPERAVLAALAMQRSLEPWAADIAESKNIELLIRVGVSTGKVIAASIGDRRQHSEDTAMGGAIALAARMESAAEPGTILVSENTYRLVESQFDWEPLGEVTVRGITQPVAVYRPLAPQAESEQLLRLQSLDLSTPLVGLDAEFESLKGCIQDLHDERGGIVMLTGDKGLGKSLLVAQVRQYLARQDALLAKAHDSDLTAPVSLTWLHSRCRSYYQSWPYSMWLDLIRSWLGIRPGQPDEEISGRLRRQTEALWGQHLADDDPILIEFPSMLEEAFSQSIETLNAEEPRQRFFQAVRNWLQAMAQRGPLVLDFGDVQWADNTSLELLKYCLPLCDQEAILWLIVFRPERTSPVWEFSHFVETEYPHRLTALTLQPLDESHSIELIERMIGPEVLPKETLNLILDKAEGNPYFILELIHSLISQGTLARDAETGTWHTTLVVDSLDLPDSLQSVFLARIDRLSAEERHVLQLASVIGRVFWSNALVQLAGDEVDLKRHLTALQRTQVISERGRVPDLGREYTFESKLICDVAYESLLMAQRAIYHRHVAEYIEGLFEKTLTQYFAFLAYHYRHAGIQNKELFYTLLAADQAKILCANTEALKLYTRALKLLDEMNAQTTDDTRLHVLRTQQFEALDGRREALFRMGHFEKGQVEARVLLSLARQMENDPVWLIDALLKQPGVAGWVNKEELSAGIPLAEEAFSLAQQVGDRRREMHSLVAIANQRLWVNDPTGWELSERVLALARELGDQSYEVGILTRMGQVYVMSDQPDRGTPYLEAALSISQALGDRIAETRLIGLIGLKFERNGDYYGFLTEVQQKRLHISREINHRPLEASTLMYCGQISATFLGDYEGGLALLDESLQIWRGTPPEAFVQLRIAQAQIMQEKLDSARDALERADRIISQHPRELGQAGFHLVSAILYNVLSGEANWQQSLEHTAQTRQLAAEVPLTRQYEMAAACKASVAHLSLAKCTADDESQTHLRRALESSQTALDIYQSFGFVHIIECVSEEIFFRHSQTLAANGRQEQAAEYLQRAYDEMMRKHDFIPEDSNFRRTYLENIPLHRGIRAAVLPV
ncbi:MAG: AAA family ATPase [Anaerolineales bacterium]|nr:AAA family ATPase [Anaerolineales bacterium]